jgi:hypothetical protein
MNLQGEFCPILFLNWRAECDARQNMLMVWFTRTPKAIGQLLNDALKTLGDGKNVSTKSDAGHDSCPKSSQPNGSPKVLSVD